MTSLETVGHLKLESNAFWSVVAVVTMELTPLGSVSLRIRIVGLPGPSNCVTHTFHDRNYLYGLNVVVVLEFGYG